LEPHPRHRTSRTSRTTTRTLLAAALGLAAAGLAVGVAPAPAADAPAKAADGPKKAAGVWTDPADPTLPADFKIQGEYVGDGAAGKMGAQLVSLGSGAFQAVLLPGGLPGEGWDAKQKCLLAGKLEGDRLTLKPAEGKRKYLAQNPDEFSATSKYPPEGQKLWSAETSADGLSLTVKTEDNKPLTLKKVMRQSPTLGTKPPAGAVVLFDGTGKDKWKGGRVDEKTGFLNTDGNDIVSTGKFKDCAMHLEFMLAYKPEGRGQGRGNSGFYPVDHYEVQILDSFGLDGKNNECGGVYTKAEPKLNMCLPPLTWQTYDVEFTAAAVDEVGKKVKNARLTLKHNGVLVHDDIEINGPTGGARNEPEGTPGPIKLQGHGNPTQFRNVWLVERK
jgi:hypothetical protein